MSNRYLGAGDGLGEEIAMGLNEAERLDDRARGLEDRSRRMAQEDKNSQRNDQLWSERERMEKVARANARENSIFGKPDGISRYDIQHEAMPDLHGKPEPEQPIGLIPQREAIDVPASPDVVPQQADTYGDGRTYAPFAGDAEGVHGPNAGPMPEPEPEPKGTAQGLAPARTTTKGNPPAPLTPPKAVAPAAPKQRAAAVEKALKPSEETGATTEAKIQNAHVAIGSLEAERKELVGRARALEIKAKAHATNSAGEFDEEMFHDYIETHGGMAIQDKLERNMQAFHEVNANEMKARIQANGPTLRRLFMTDLTPEIRQSIKAILMSGPTGIPEVAADQVANAEPVMEYGKAYFRVGSKKIAAEDFFNNLDPNNPLGRQKDHSDNPYQTKVIIQGLQNEGRAARASNKDDRFERRVDAEMAVWDDKNPDASDDDRKRELHRVRRTVYANGKPTEEGNSTKEISKLEKDFSTELEKAKRGKNSSNFNARLSIQKLRNLYFSMVRARENAGFNTADADGFKQQYEALQAELNGGKKPDAASIREGIVKGNKPGDKPSPAKTPNAKEQGIF